MSSSKSAFVAVLLIAVACPAIAQGDHDAVRRAMVLVPRGNEQASFDCTKASTAAARLICADGELAALNGALGDIGPVEVGCGAGFLDQG
jgi:hypothetical protein